MTEASVRTLAAVGDPASHAVPRLPVAGSDGAALPPLLSVDPTLGLSSPLADHLDLQVDTDLHKTSLAVFSRDGAYRYLLARRFRASPTGADRFAVWLMLNPSTADAFADDPTIGACRDFSVALGCHGLLVVNLFALRATKPRVLYGHERPIGPANDAFLAALAADPAALGGPIIAAWGNHGALHGRAADVRALLHRRHVPLQHLVLNASGEPKHPLYVKRTVVPTPLPLLAPLQGR